MDEDAPITARARWCIRLFQDCPEPVSSDWADDQLSRFKIWASNLGIFARGHASLDYRLGPLGSHSPESYRLIFQLLDAIGANLEFSRLFPGARNSALTYLVHGLFNRPEPVHRLAHYLDAEDVQSKDDGSASASDDEDLKEACDEVEDAIRRLNVLSASIRRAGARHREVKALKFKGKTKLEKRQTKQFATVTAARIEYMFPRTKEQVSPMLIPLGY